MSKATDLPALRASSRWTSVVSYHTDPERCGVARFSHQLAQRLGVPLSSPHRGMPEWGESPLLSIKWSEWVRCELEFYQADQLWHDEPPDYYQQRVTGRVWKLYEIGVPALVEPTLLARKALLTMGMAHKPELDLFARVKAFFPDKQLWISTAEHEGAGPSKVPDLMALWGPHARNLGHLSDAALELVWERVSLFVAFFAGGLRANNSSVHAALDAGVPVLTNHGPQTPSDLLACTLDISDLGHSHLVPALRSPYTWDRLLKELECHER